MTIKSQQSEAIYGLQFSCDNHMYISYVWSFTNMDSQCIQYYDWPQETEQIYITMICKIKSMHYFSGPPSRRWFFGAITLNVIFHPV